jgi:uncharacterized protein (TIGR02391 family)
MPQRWDNIEILRAVDRFQEQAGGAPAWQNGSQLMEEVAGERVNDEQRSLGFVNELHIAHHVGLLTFDLMRGIAPPNPRSNPRYYLDQLKDFALTPAGQDRVRGRAIVREPPDPNEDDGRPISNLLLEQIATAIENEYNARQRETFLREADLPLDQLSLQRSIEDVGWIHEVLNALDEWGSEGRRNVRRFVGQWLDDRLIFGPDESLRSELVEKFARQGWYVVDGNLVNGDPSRGTRASSPILRDARLGALHPIVLEVARPYVLSEHYGAAIFEAVKALNNRVKEMTQSSGDGTALMQKVFSSDNPQLVLRDLDTPSGRNTQDGFRFIFAGIVQAVRNPSAHDPFQSLALNEALEYLGFVSLLMRQLDEAKPPIV